MGYEMDGDFQFAVLYVCVRVRLYVGAKGETYMMGHAFPFFLSFSPHPLSLSFALGFRVLLLSAPPPPSFSKVCTGHVAFFRHLNGTGQTLTARHNLKGGGRADGTATQLGHKLERTFMPYAFAKLLNTDWIVLYKYVTLWDRTFWWFFLLQSLPPHFIVFPFLGWKGREGRDRRDQASEGGDSE